MGEAAGEPMWFKRIVFTYFGLLIGGSILISAAAWALSISTSGFLLMFALFTLVALFAGASKMAPPEDYDETKGK